MQILYPQRAAAPGIPLYSSPVAAGFPSPAQDYVEGTLNLDQLMIERPAATFFVRVDGESMAGAGICPGDILVVDRSIKPRSQHIVIACIDGDFTVKRLIQQGQGYTLVAENPLTPPVQINESCHIWGVVTGVVRKLV